MAGPDEEVPVTGRTAPFAGFEWLIAWRYLRARRAEGGVSVMTWISLLGITLAVFALIATLAVRAGFRDEFVHTILGGSAHATILPAQRYDETGPVSPGLPDYASMTARVAAVPGVLHAYPVVRGQVLAAARTGSTGAQVIGVAPDDLRAIPGLAPNDRSEGDPADFGEGLAIGIGLATDLGVQVGDTLRLVSPDGARTAFGTSPRTGSYRVGYIFSVGYYDIDHVRIYMPFAEAQSFFNRDGVADGIEAFVADPERIEAMIAPSRPPPAPRPASGPGATTWARSCAASRSRTT